MSKFKGKRTDNKGELTNEYKQFIATRIYAERQLKGLNQKDFAKAVGVSNQTFNNLEQGKGSLKIEYLYQIANFCGCDIGYLLGECDNRTYKATDICEATGLSEEAVDILTTINRWYNEESNGSDNFDTFDYNFNMVATLSHSFISLIDNIVTSYDFDELFNGEDNTDKRNHFPISKIARYLNTRKRLELVEENENFDLVKELYQKYKDNTHILIDKDTGHTMVINNAFTIQADIENELKKMNYKQNEIDYISNSTEGFLDIYYRMKDDRGNKKLDIQNDFLRYLDGTFIEGENNGK